MDQNTGAMNINDILVGHIKVCMIYCLYALHARFDQPSFEYYGPTILNDKID